MFLGEETDRATCTTCGGGVRVKVFACQMHGRATIGKQIEGATNCAGCKDWRPIAQPQAMT